MDPWNKNSDMDLRAKMSSVRPPHFPVSQHIKFAFLPKEHFVMTLLHQTRDQLTVAANTAKAARVATRRSNIYKGYRTSGAAPNNFREISIFPTRKDLAEEHPFLRPNIVEGILSANFDGEL